MSCESRSSSSLTVLSKWNGQIEDSIWSNRSEEGASRENTESRLESGVIFLQTSREKCSILGMSEDLRKSNLRQGRRADLQHLRDDDRLDILSEFFIFVCIVDFDPSTSSPWPGEILADPLHRYGWHLSDDLGEWSDRRGIEDDMLIDLIEYQKAPISTSDIDDSLQICTRMDDSCWIIRIDHEDSADRLIMLDFLLEPIEIDPGSIIEIEMIKYRTTTMIEGF